MRQVFKNVFFFVFIIGGLTVLQVFLSLRRNKWYGLLLPGLYALLAAFASFGQMMYTGSIAPVLVTFLMLLIPAALNFVIYLACRARAGEKRKSELDRMNIQDLD